jgi:acetylornithine deacetylase/succinyl-diaminopimelate desuccinylase-like protein
MASLSLTDFERDALPALTEYATIPCLSPAFDANWQDHGHIDAAAELLANWIRERKFNDLEVEIHRVEGRTPVLVATIGATAETPGTCVLYGHLDKQPPLGNWSEGLDPFHPVRRGDRLYARGVADDGYSTFSAILALEAMEREGHGHARCVVLIEASEESGSPDLDAYLDLLAPHLGDVQLMICLDSGALTYDRLWVTTSLRGIINVELTVSVLEYGQHSGSASGVIPSSFRILRQLIERIEDSATGDILIPQLHGVIPSSVTNSAESVAAEFGDVIAKELPSLDGLELMGASPADRIIRRTWYPTLSVVGMAGIPDPSIAGNVLRPSTTAVLSLRVPPNVNASEAAQALEKVLTESVPSNARVETSFTFGEGWVAPDLAPWLSEALIVASTDAFGREPGFTGEGGSIPFLGELAKRYPGVQFVATGVLGPQSNAHAIDEMLDIPTAVAVSNAVMTIIAAHANSIGE